MPAQDYYSRFYYEVYGQEKVAEAAKTIQQTATQTRTSSDTLRLWSDAMTVATNNGYTFDTALRVVQRSLKQNGIDVGAFTDRLKANIRETDQAIVASDRYAASLRKQAEAAAASALAEKSRTESIIGRIGGRIGGATIGSQLGIPGSGFIGSQLVQGLGISGNAALGIGAGAVGLFAGFELAKQIGDITKYAQEQRNLSKEIGVTISQMDALSRVSKVTGVDLETSAKGVQKLQEELVKGGSKSKDIQNSFKELGVNLSTAFGNPADALKTLSEALVKIQNEADRTRLADALGIKDLNAIAESFPDLSERFRIDDESMQRLARARDLMVDMKETLSQSFASFISYGISAFMPDVPHQVQSKEQSNLTSTFGATRGVIRPTGPIRIGGGTAFTARTPAEEQAARVGGFQSIMGQYGTPEDVYSATASGISQQEDLVKRNYDAIKMSPDQAKEEIRSLESKKAAAKATEKQQIEIRGEWESFRKLVDEPKDYTIEGVRKTVIDLNSIPRRYPHIYRSQEVQQYIRSVSSTAFGPLSTGMTEMNSVAMGKLADTLTKKKDADYERAIRGDITQGQADLATTTQATSDIISGVTQTGKTRAAIIAGQATIAGGFSRVGLTPAQISRIEFQNSMAKIRGGQSQVSDLMYQSGVAQEGANIAGRNVVGGPEQARLKAEARKYESEAIDKSIELRTQENEAIIKLNESIDKVREAMAKDFAGGFAGILMGAQKGAMHGQAGKGALDALRGFAEGIESKVLQNIGELVWNKGAGSVAQKIGSKLPSVLTKGTILEDPGSKEQLKPAIDANVVELRMNTAALDRVYSRLIWGSGCGGGGGSSSTTQYGGFGVGTPGGVGPDGMPWGGGLGNPTFNPSIPGISGTAYDIGSTAAAITPLAAAVAAGASPLAVLATVGSTLGKLGTSLAQGASHAGNITYITGQASGETTAQQVGAIAGTAGIGLAAAGGIMTAAKGGAKNISGGIAETLGAVAAIPGPQQPFVAAAAAVAGLVSAFLPDPRTVRAQQIEKTMFTQQYMAPPPENLMEGGNAGYTDFDAMGNVRTSNFSPYPVVAGSYLDVPRRTVVPGRTISSFGGYSNTPGAKNPNTPTYNLTVNAIDSKDIIAHGPAIVDAFHQSIQDSYHPVVSTLRQQLGVSPH